MDLRRRVFNEVDLKRRLLAGMVIHLNVIVIILIIIVLIVMIVRFAQSPLYVKVMRRKCCDCHATTFPRPRSSSKVGQRTTKEIDFAFSFLSQLH